MLSHSSRSSGWAELFEAAREFRDARLWKHLTDRVLFGIRVAETGPILHCAIMGAGGEVFGLAVYPGAEGLRAYERTLAFMRAEGGDSNLSLKQQLRALAVNFEHEEDLDEVDIDLIRDQGLIVDGPQKCPQFRSYEPGYVESLPNEKERSWLVVALNGAREFVDRLLDERLPDLDKLGQDEIVVLKPRTDAGGWAQEIETLDRGSGQLGVPAVDKLRLRRLSKSASRGGVWEAGAYWMPAADEDEDSKPYFPLLCIWADHNTDLVLHIKLATPAEGLGKLQTSGIEFMEKNTRIPEIILVRSDKAVHLLEPVTDVLQIELRKVGSLEVLDHVASTFEQKMRFGNPPGSKPEMEGEEALMLQIGEAYADLLNLFEDWLIEQGFAWSTVERHGESVEAFFFGFLMEVGPMAPDDGLFQVEQFFEHWLPSQRRWTSRQRIQAIIPGLKKFAAFLRDQDLLEEDDYQDFLALVKERKDDWVRSALGSG